MAKQVKREAKIYTRKVPSGNTSFRVDLGKINGKRVTKDFKQEMEAQKFAVTANEKLLRRNSGALQDLMASHRYEVLSCLEKLKPFNASLNDAMDFFTRFAQPRQAALPIEKAIQLFVAEKRKAKRRERYIKAIQNSYLTPLEKRKRNIGNVLQMFAIVGCFKCSPISSGIELHDLPAEKSLTSIASFTFTNSANRQQQR
ncbi:MAG: hypothetical protein ABIP20_03595 [Chthoniobacteraceae bacterium]